MDRIVLAVPVMYNFKGYTQLMASVDIPVLPYVYNNWDVNRGVSRAWNDAIDDNQNADVLIISNDDIIFEPGCLETLVRNIRNGYDLATAVNTRDFPKPEDCNPEEPDYSCFAVDPVLFVSKHGYFDENFTPAYFEDNDMAYRIKLNEGKQVKLASARMFHKGSQTQLWNGEEGRVVSHQQFETNRGYYIGKWGGTPGNEVFKRPFNTYTFDTKHWTKRD